MKPLILLLFLLATGSAQAANLDALPWEATLKSDHFILYHQDAPQEYINKVIDAAENNYKDITFQLGFTRFEGFWVWEKRAKIYLFRNKQEYKRFAKQPEWSGAGVNVLKREMVTYLGDDDFFENTLPHEMGHLIFREFVGYKRKLPLWLDEGIASYLEKRFNKERLLIVKIMFSYGLFIDLAELEQINLRNMVMPDLFYYESASIIDFLIENYGKEKFFAFCNALKDLPTYESWEKALYSVYSFDGEAQMNKEWIEYLKKIK